MHLLIFIFNLNFIILVLYYMLGVSRIKRDSTLVQDRVLETWTIQAPALIHQITNWIAFRELS